MGNWPRRSQGIRRKLDGQYLAKETEALRLARLEGIRPISVGRLLSLLDYEFGSKITGQVEAKSEEAIDALIHPLGRRVVPPAADDEAMPDDDAMPADDEEDAGERMNDLFVPLQLSHKNRPRRERPCATRPISFP